MDITTAAPHFHHHVPPGTYPVASMPYWYQAYTEVIVCPSQRLSHALKGTIMSADLLAPLARLTATAEAIEGLRDLFAAEESLDVVAGRVAETALAAIPHADVISITVLSWPDARTVACTHEQALDLDHQQYASGRGPCLEAA